MAFKCIRNETNYGYLAVYELDGIRFACNEHYADVHRAKEIEVKELPEFLDSPCIQVEISEKAGTVGHIFVFDKKDLRPLAIALSKELHAYVKVYMHARILASWIDGVVKREQVTLDYFYSGLTEEAIEESRF